MIEFTLALFHHIGFAGFAALWLVKALFGVVILRVLTRYFPWLGRLRLSRRRPQS